ncbi:succinate--CoA ligase subunit alpha [candidate division WOR-3 bacterium]|uniref:Succinate--CoA ligase [ADP-forming] subunit alpha n=1 Tax=candidate division WOR-3 bacterium TaxID=2052148 RepID=A0A660SHN2_UNCW3|nr:MAG: succinate--CoA ligase subunit alpha [candidate division WOR-3 bacterium]
MSILVGKETKLLVQGITGRDGSFHARMMKEYGTNVVAGVTPGKGGSSVDGIPVFNSVHEAKEKTGANTSVIFVPARFAVDAIYEAIDAELDLIVCISEGIPTLEMAKVMSYLRGKKTRLIGPNSPGLISPEEAKVGILPGHIFKKGSIGVISRSGTLTYEIVYHITNSGFGESTCIGIGGDQIIGTKFIDCLKLFREDDETEAVVLVGEIGGQDEEETAAWIRENFNKPVFGFIAGKTAPPEKRMGHAGAIISGGSGTAPEKIKAFKEAGIIVGETPKEVAERVKERLS